MHKWDQGEYAWVCDVWALDEGSEVLAAYVTIKDHYGEYRTFGVKDPVKSDFDGDSSADPGESVYVDVVIKNEHADQLLSNIHFQIVVLWGTYLGDEMVSDSLMGEDMFLMGKDMFFYEVYTLVSTTNTNPYENYAIIFDGVDMEPYYDYYHENYQAWRKDYLN